MKIHELLAVEKTRTAAWHTVLEDCLKKFGKPEDYYSGHSKALAMIEDNEANKALELSAREEKPVITTALDTLEYFFREFEHSENLQMAKNSANQTAKATIMWEGKPLLADVPFDECLGLEARLARIRKLILSLPTLDAGRHWERDPQAGRDVWVTKYADETTKTEKVVVPVVLSPATDKHPAQVQPMGKDVVVGRYSTTHRSGAATAAQKAEMIRRIDALLTEVKKARQRCNEADVIEKQTGAGEIVRLLLEPLKTATN